MHHESHRAVKGEVLNHEVSPVNMRMDEPKQWR